MIKSRVLPDFFHNAGPRELSCVYAGQPFFFPPTTPEGPGILVLQYSNDANEQAACADYILRNMFRMGITRIDEDEFRENPDKYMRMLDREGLQRFAETLTREFETRYANDNARLLEENKDARPPDPIAASWLKIRDKIVESLRIQKQLTADEEMLEMERRIEHRPHVDLNLLPKSKLHKIAKDLGVKASIKVTKSELMDMIKDTGKIDTITVPDGPDEDGDEE